ncbi:pilus assembly protein TadG-related protein [Bradyrhizobium viridifuturi]|uniref:pilus assembly protein TadG-related protein n=1 Tax=Bradyrhizobium viridifuturi TaxID=1654716 RepID=UPI000AA86037|nr:pilus assembly protein TadG-related protein [Bradyrhizobium viridifuturi]
MRNVLRCRRGSVAFATVVAMIPLIGFLALGGEAGSWYVTQQRAQNAADAAAFSGGLQAACLTSGSTCTATGTADSRGKQSAAQNAFCNSGDTSYVGSICSTSLPTGVSQSVAIASLTTYGGNPGTYVQATVSQTQPTYLAQLLGLSNVTIGAIAVAKVQGAAKPPCALALTGTIGFQGSPNINAPNCGMASNDAASNALDFTGGGMSMNLGSLSAAGGCTGSSTFCNTAYTYMPPVTNPFSALDSVTLPTLSACSGSGTLTAYSASTPCRNNNVTLTGNSTINLTGGVYFISGTLTLKGSTAISGTALFILLPGASFSMKGTGTITITGNASVTNSQLPTVLQSSTYTSLFSYMAIWDLSNVAVQFGGNSNINLSGTMYAPNADVTFQGNPTIDLGGGNGCGELIAKSIAFNGNASFNSNGCPTSTVPSTPQYVQLVQ